MESKNQIIEAFRLLGEGKKEQAMAIAEKVESESSSLDVEDLKDISSIYFANKQFDKALKTLEGQEDMNSILL